MGKLVICGDSFNIGIGCWDLKKEPYGSLLAEHLGLDLINLAKASASMANIFLQVKYAVETYSDIDYLLMSSTTYDRFDWFPEDYYIKGDVTLKDVNYHEYPPYQAGTYVDYLENPLKDVPGYRGGMFTETPAALIQLNDLFKKWQKNPDERENTLGGYWYKFRNEDPNRIKSLFEYIKQIYDTHTNRVKCHGLMVMAHSMLRKKGIKHLILNHEPEALADYIDNENLMLLNWYCLAQQYPDQGVPPPPHTSELGHRVAFIEVLKKFKENGWIDGQISLV